MEYTFEQLPKAVKDIADKVNNIERMLLEKASTSPADSSDIVSIKEAADYINLTIPTIYGLVHRSEIPVSKKGKRLYFSKKELTEWIKTGRRKTNDEILEEKEIHFNKSKRKR